MDTKTHSGNFGEPIIIRISQDEPFAEIMLGSFEDRDRLPYMFSVQPDTIFVFGVKGFTAFRVPTEDKLCDLRTVVFDEDSLVMKYLDYVISVTTQPNEYLVYIHPDKYMLRHEFEKLSPIEGLEV